MNFFLSGLQVLTIQASSCRNYRFKTIYSSGCYTHAIANAIAQVWEENWELTKKNQ